MLAAADEAVHLNARRHGIVLARPLAWAVALGLAGAFVVLRGWLLPLVGALALAGAAVLAFRAVLRWERTRVVVTSDKLFVVYGLLRRRAAAVRLERVETVEVEQSLLGHLLGYGTIVAGNLEIPYVAEPREVLRVLR